MTADRRDASRRILEIVPQLMRTVSAELRRTEQGLSPSHFRLLAMLSRGPWTLSDLADHNMVSLPTISRSISTLEDRGWAKRSRSATDRRVVHAGLTPAGREIFARICRRAEERVELVLRSLTNEDRQALENGLTVLEKALAEDPAGPGVALRIGRTPSEVS